MQTTYTPVYRPLRPTRHWGIFMCLLDHPQTVDEIGAAFRSDESIITRTFRYFETGDMPGRVARAAETLPEDLRRLFHAGWLARERERYTLTPAGREMALLMSARTRTVD